MKRGTPITVYEAPRFPEFLDHEFREGFFVLQKGNRITYRYRKHKTRLHGQVLEGERGVRWARGHGGREVDALKTTIALGDGGLL